MTATWSEARIAGALARGILERKCLVVVPNCSWTGNECDLLAVTRDLRVVDVEIKISRADLKADAGKAKWRHHWDPAVDGPWQGWDAARRRPRLWPNRVWKHYYAVPAAIWKPELADSLGSASGVLLLSEGRAGDVDVRCWRRARPCRDAQRLTPAQAVDIARLASLRMWDALIGAERYQPPIAEAA